MNNEAAEPEEGQNTLADELAEARAEIVALSAERDAERDRALRMAAEAENTRRRLERDKSEAVQYAAAGFARDILTVADNLARAVESLPADEALAPLRAGIEATQRELAAIFERHGVKRVAAVGLPLDPNCHQAMVEVESDAEPGTVVSELQAGWILKERLLRPALVTVARARGEAAA
ncbi:MAG: nucleotide exchange factor GrpE [Sandarakinorhabdus sp.]|nr:nucleotide exchange factor GrpE [Sandarakinorhabdus sp.]MBS3962664.1 nucleotide exchange factor GrpE [Sandarakinorhabdus sp.]